MAIVNVTKEFGNRLGGFEKYLYEEILLLCESKEILQLKNDVNAPEYLNYKALYGDGDIWVRPASMWNEEIILADGSKTKRFVLVEEI